MTEEELERTRRLDDAARFERLWQGVRERAARNGVPEVLAAGYGQVAELGEGLAAAEGLDARQRELVAEWREIDAEQGAMAEAARGLPGRVTAWLERRDAELPLDRITHHVHILEMNADSYRLKQSRSRRRQPSE